MSHFDGRNYTGDSGPPGLETQVDDLLTRLFDERITEAEFARLDALVCQYAEARRRYVQHFETHSGLHRYWGGQGSAPPIPNVVEVDQSLASRGQPAWEAAYDVVSNYVALSLLISSIFMAILLLSMGLIVPETKQPRKASPDIEFIAEISDTFEATWDGASDGNFTNRSLFSGDTLVLVDGFAEVSFANGATVLLEGPATLVTTSAAAGKLRVGRLTARVPQKAVGFTVATPFGLVEDLGTEFGVEVNDAGNADVVVFEGKVRVDSSKGTQQRLLLIAGEAANVSPTGARAVDNVMSLLFVRNIPSLVRGEVVLAVDFNDRDAAGKATTQAGFEEFVLQGDSFDLDAEVTFGALTVRVERVGGAGLDDRRRETPVNMKTFSQEQLLRDFIFGPNDPGEALRIIIGGLEAGRRYEGTLWSFDPVSKGTRVSQWFANDKPIADPYEFAGEHLPLNDSEYQMVFRSFADEGGKITIEGHHSLSPKGTSLKSAYTVYLNALQLQPLVLQSAKNEVSPNEVSKNRLEIN